MFRKDCENKDLHETHVFEYKWSGHDSPTTYRCPGVQFSEESRLAWERNNRAFFMTTGGHLDPLGAPLVFHGDEKVRPYPLKLDLENGKYTLVMSEDGTVTALRHGEPWREFVGDKFMHNLARHIFGLEDHE